LFEGNEEDFQSLDRHGYKIYKAIFALRLMQVTQCYVFLLAVLRNFERLGTDPTQIFQFIEKFTFQYSVISKQPANKIEKVYSNAALKIEAALRDISDNKIGAAIQSVFTDLKRDLKKVAPSEQLFKESFGEISYKNSETNRRLLKYILSEINSHHSTTDEHKIDFNTVNIEHILPQNPDKNLGIKKSDIKGFMNKLGNLTLLSKKINSRVQNYGVEKKLPYLEESKLPITESLVEQLKAANLSWGEDQIKIRQNVLAHDAFNEIWRI
jgi:hypothetical protein